MTTRETADALGVSERTIQRRAAELGITVNGVNTILNETEVTLIKKMIEKSGRSDLDNVVELANVNTDLEMMILDSKVSEWKTRKIEELQRQLDGANEKIAIDSPKVEFYDQVAESKDAIDMRTVAAVLNIKGLGRNKLFDKLRTLEILDGDNRPYRKYQDAGYFRVIETKFVDSFGDAHINIKTLVYQRGLDFIRKAVSK